jgi:hypothetical protein
MSAFAPITLATAGVFSPSSIDSQGVAKLFGVGPAGFDTRPAISLSVRLPKVGGSVARVTAKGVIPNLDPVTNLKIGECVCTMEFVMPKTAVDTDRANLLALAKEFLANAAVTAAVEDLESIY